MQFDTFTFIAQIINFAILVFLLYRFLYRPVLNVMKKREQQIADNLQKAQEKEAKAQELQVKYQENLDSFERTRHNRVKQVKNDIENLRHELLEEARREVEEQKTKWEDALKKEQDTFLREVGEKTRQQIGQTLRKIMMDLANSELERQIEDIFLQKLEQLDEEKKQQLVKSAILSNRPFIIRTAYQIPDNKRKQIWETVSNMFNDSYTTSLDDHLEDMPAENKKVSIRFKEEPDMIAGIELQADGRIISWSIEEYLNQLDERILKIIHEEAQSDNTYLRDVTSNHNKSDQDLK